ncbi:probable protein DEK [Coccomyxa sp. Obi]|nr:probable protein DEK [Coccomyxa sp. Obi]
MAEDKGEPAPMDVEEKPATAAEPNATAPETTGPRKRKQVEFFAPADVKKPEKLVIKEGKGTKLADIPNVVFHFSKVTGKDELLEELHFLLFKRRGKLATRKKEILGFSGFVYDGTAEDGRAKVAEKLNKWKLEDIHRLMDMLDLARGSGSKEAKVNALMEFLEAPKVLKDVDLAEKAAKAKEKAKSKKEKETAKKEKEVAKKEKGAAKKEKEVAKKEKAAEKEPAKKKAKKETPAKEEGTAKKKAKPTPKKKAKAPVEEPEEEEEEENEDDELPLAKAAAAPSDEELREETLAILETVQLEDFTMKDLLRRLSEKYKMPFQKRRDFLKEIVNSFVAKHRAAAADEAEEEPHQAAEPEQETAAQEEATAEPMEIAEEPEKAQEAIEEPAEVAAAEEKPAEEPAEAAPAEEKPAEEPVAAAAAEEKPAEAEAPEAGHAPAAVEAAAE